jgi:hypothetical protein
MPKQSEGQKETVERVMHEFKHGELQSGNGRKVTNPKQAIAIGLSEAGASNQQTPAENNERRKETKSRERKGQTGKARAEGDRSKSDLYAEAKKRDIPGRSKMDKSELERALRR